MTTPASPHDDNPLRELEARRTRSALGGGTAATDAWHAKGRMTARERIAAFADPGSFHELGRLAGSGRYDAQGRYLDFTPANSIIGRAAADGRPLMIVADDFTIRGGSSEAAVAEKWIYGERMALELRMPLLRFVDSAGGSVKLLEKAGRTKLPGYPLWPSTALMGAVPVASVAFGSCAGLAAIRATAAHFSVMVREQSQVFAAGPPVVKQGLGIEVSKEDLGGVDICTRISGAILNAADDEPDALAQVRRFLSYFPDNAWQAPATRTSVDDPQRRELALDHAIPANRRHIYAVRPIVDAIVDHDSAFELAADFGGSLRTYLARLDGHAVGVMINDPSVMGGALTRAAAQKMERFVDCCDSFHLPIVHLVDQPGVMIGPDAERAGTLLAAARAGAAIEQASVPWVSIVMRRAYGVAGSMLGPWSGPNGTSLNHRFAWPSARWGSLPIEGGVAAAYRREIDAAPDPQAHRAILEAYYEQLGSPYRTAEAFGVVDIIAPSETRPLLCHWMGDAVRLTRARPEPKRRTMR